MKALTPDPSPWGQQSALLPSPACGRGAGGEGPRRVDRMQLHQLVDDIQAQLACHHRVESQLRGQVLARDDAGDALHHEEVAAHHGRVVADGQYLGHDGVGGCEGPHHARLAQHVVGALRLVAEGRAAQHQLATRVAQEIGEIGRPARELADLRRALEARDARLEEGVHARHVELLALANLAGAIDERRNLRHVAAPLPSRRAFCRRSSSLAMSARCTSSGPSAMRRIRA